MLFPLGVGSGQVGEAKEVRAPTGSHIPIPCRLSKSGCSRARETRRPGPEGVAGAAVPGLLVP